MKQSTIQAHIDQFYHIGPPAEKPSQFMAIARSNSRFKYQIADCVNPKHMITFGRSQRERMIHSIVAFLAIPLTFAVGFFAGRLARNRLGIIVSVVAGAFAYVGGLFIFAGVQIIWYELLTQILMGAFGALCSLFGWCIGAFFFRK